MNTPAHLIFGAAAFGKPGRPDVTAAAVFGALLPDLSLYLMVSWAMFVRGIDARVIFDELYFSEAWQAVFAVDNSMPIWGIALALGLWRRWPVLTAFAGAGLLHLVFDLACTTRMRAGISGRSAMLCSAVRSVTGTATITDRSSARWRLPSVWRCACCCGGGLPGGWHGG